MSYIVDTDRQEREELLNKVIFVLLCFCALIVVVPLLSMKGQKALGFHQIIS